ncbi:MAG: hypothetical protein ACXW18_06905 [Pyrinomonadaceae bacterium]
MTIGLVGTGIVVLWPEKRWVGWVFIGLGLLIALLSIVWALAFRYARKEFEMSRPSPSAIPTQQPTQNLTQTGIDFKPHIEVKPTFTQSQEQSEKKSVVEKEKVPSELECTDCYFVQGYLEGSNRLARHVEGMLVGGGGKLCNVAQADFYLKPVAGSDPGVELRSQLVFYDKNGIERLKRVSDGVWRETVNFIQMPLNTGDTRRLVIAVDLGDAGLNSYEYAERRLRRQRFNAQGVFTHPLAPEMTRLNADEVTVQVLLSGKYLDEVTLNKEVWFKLSRPERVIKKIDSPRGIETDMKIQF